MKRTVLFLQVLLFTLAAAAQDQIPEQNRAATKGVKVLVSELKDPASFKLVRVWTATERGKKGGFNGVLRKKRPDTPDRQIICFEYRAKNSLGGYERSTVAMGLDGLPLDDIGRRTGTYIISSGCLNETADITEAVAKDLGMKKSSGLVKEWEQ